MRKPKARIIYTLECDNGIIMRICDKNGEDSYLVFPEYDIYEVAEEFPVFESEVTRIYGAPDFEEGGDWFDLVKEYEGR